jgi:hypothetical protein
MQSLHITVPETITHFLTLQEINQNIQTNPLDIFNKSLTNALNSKSFTMIDGSQTTSRLLFGWPGNNPSNIIIYEVYEIKNIYFVYPHTVMHNDHPDMIEHDYYMIIKKIYDYLVSNCLSEQLFKLFDFKIVLTLPINVNLSGCYKYGPTTTNVLGQTLPNTHHEWFNYNIKLNQYHAQHRQHREIRTKHNEKHNEKHTNNAVNITMSDQHTM